MLLTFPYLFGAFAMSVMFLTWLLKGRKTMQSFLIVLVGCAFVFVIVINFDLFSNMITQVLLHTTPVHAAPPHAPLLHHKGGK